MPMVGMIHPMQCCTNTQKRVQESDKKLYTYQSSSHIQLLSITNEIYQSFDCTHWALLALRFFIIKRRSFLLILNDYNQLLVLKLKTGSMLVFWTRVHCSAKDWLNSSAFLWKSDMSLLLTRRGGIFPIFFYSKICLLLTNAFSMPCHDNLIFSRIRCYRVSNSSSNVLISMTLFRKKDNAKVLTCVLDNIRIIFILWLCY